MADYRISEDASTDRELRVAVWPHRALPDRAMWWLIGVFGAVSAAIAMGFAAFGAWPVLPFAGLEVLILALALVYYRRRTRDGERIVIRGDRVEVTCVRHASESRQDFQRYWTRVHLERDKRGWYRSRLTLGSHGRHLEIGAMLNDEERLALYYRLKAAIESGDTT
jgi:uncharacterized membrane protein